jgi:hypothetical protein
MLNPIPNCVLQTSRNGSTKNGSAGPATSPFPLLNNHQQAFRP